MANARKMLEAMAVRMLLMGYPGSGKTGCLAALVNAGFKLRIIDFDGNPESLIRFSNPDMLGNVDICSFEDPITYNGDHVAVNGIPVAFSNAFKMLDRWKYKDADGAEVDLGQSKEWGPDTIVVIDGVTGMGKAAFYRAMAKMNRKPGNISSPVWGLAMQEQMAMIQRLCSENNKHHVIMLSHIRMIGPKEIGEKDNDTNKEIKAAAAELIPTRLWPSGLGRENPPQIAGEFPVTVLAEAEARGHKVARKLFVTPRPELTIKLPVKDAEKLNGLPIETGMLDIFKALGALPPK